MHRSANGKRWLLTIDKGAVVIQYVVPDEYVAGLIAGTTAQTDVLDIHCVPYLEGDDPEMAVVSTRPPRAAA